MGNKLELRNLTLNDRDFFFRLYTDSDVIRYVSTQKTEQEIQDAFEHRLPEWTLDSTHWLCLVIEDIETKQSIGLIGFCLQAIDEQLVAEVGYLIDPHFAGKGIATKALSLLLSNDKYSKINVFSATVTSGNFASEKVLTNNGFCHHKIIKDNYQINGAIYDDIIYQLNR